MKKVLFLMVVTFSVASVAQVKKVCFSFDDLPVVAYGTTDTTFQRELFDKLIVSLNRNKIPAIGFVNEMKLYDERGLIPFQVDLLKSWVRSGLELGNHTYSHPDYNTVSFADYTADILKGERITREILRSRGERIKYFRHPFLHLGNTKAKADSLDSFLHEHGYTVAPVTIDNEDYLFALAYKKAMVRNDTSLMRRIGHDYLAYMEQKLEYFEREARSLFGRDIAQILLLHASSLNSDYLDSLAAIFKTNHYTFVSMDEALKDDAYKTDITVFDNWGICWLDRWALSRGKSGGFFKGEPLTPDYIKKLDRN